MPVLRKRTQGIQGGCLSKRELYRLLQSSQIRGVDTETSGVDFHHGAQPFALTLCDNDLDQEFYEWDVDPFTRKVTIPEEDLYEVQEVLQSDVLLILQNAKFDAANITQELRKLKRTQSFEWAWNRTVDTLYGGHLLRSNQPHDLTTMVLVYLGINILPYEETLEKCVKECLKLIKTPDFIKDHGEWRYAREGLPEMPSAKGGSDRQEERPWKFDTWLPRAVANVLDYPANHLYRKVLPEYMNADSSSTLMLFKRMVEIIEDRDLMEIYLERLKLLRVVYAMEQTGICINRLRLKELVDEYGEEHSRLSRMLINLAKGVDDYDLALPKGAANNGSVSRFIFDKLQLPVVRYTKSKKKKTPSLDKYALDEYQITLPPRSKGLKFVTWLRGRRKRASALGYMTSYEKFWLNEDGDLFRVYPSLNPTGTDTLRWSSYNPNEQQISKKGMTDDDRKNVRYCFGPAPGREWWSLDYDNLELRIPAYESGEPAMLELFEHPERPPYFGSYHLLIFDLLHPKMFAEHGVKVKDIYESTWYGWTKAGNFSDQYGSIEESGTADRAFHVEGAQHKVSKLLSKKTELNQKWIKFAQKHGYVETMPDMEVDPHHGYPLYCSRTRGRVKPTVPLSYHVQGTACWIMMRAMVKIQEYFDVINKGKRHSEQWHIVMNVHDEVVIDGPYVKNKGNLPIAQKVQGIMESLGKVTGPGVRLTAKLKYHTSNWATAV